MNFLNKFFILKALFFIFLCFSYGHSHAACDDCWVPDLNFDIENQGLIRSMIFISGHSYSISMSNRELNEQEKENFFCKEGDVGSSELVEILNNRLSGVVSSEQVTLAIADGLKKRYPCKN